MEPNSPPLKLVMKLRCITVSAVSGGRLYNGDEVELFGGFARTANVTWTYCNAAGWDCYETEKRKLYDIYIYPFTQYNVYLLP